MNTLKLDLLLKLALEKSGLGDIGELKKVFDAGLGTSLEGRMLLNSKDFSFADIKVIRAQLSKH